MKEVISISEISYKVKEKTIIDHISFTVNEGESFALLGENGAGKSTLIDLILNDLKPTIGTVSFLEIKNMISLMWVLFMTIFLYFHFSKYMK